MKRFLILLLLLIPGCVPTEDVVKPAVPDKEETVEFPEAVEPEDLIKELHWTHMPVTYFIVNEEECGDYEVRKIGRAFDAISNATNSVVSFEKVDYPADIDITCSFLEGCYEKKVDIQETVIYRYEIICAHNRGRARIIAVRDYEILKAEIELFGLAGFAETTRRGPSGFYVGSCGHPNTEIHEILHVFGYGHVNNPDSIMYPSEESVGLTMQEEGACIGSKKSIDKEIADDLVRIYSQLE